MVEQVEKLRAELQPRVLPRERELLDDGKVGVDEVGPIHRYTGSISKVAYSVTEAGWVEILCLGLVGVEVASRHDVGAVPIVSVSAVVEKDARGVIAVDYGVSKTRSDLFDYGQLPSALANG